MEMSQIRYFIAVSETLNFTRAAERCFISQPALTKGIKKLEQSMGGELLHRTKNSVELSFLGATLLPKFIKIYQDAKQTRDEAHRLLSKQCELIRVGIQTNIFLGKVLPLFQMYKRLNAKVELEFYENDFQQLKDKLSSHELDVVFLSHIIESNTPLPEHRIATEDFVVAVGAKHDWVQRKHISVNELHLQSFCYREHCDSSRQLQRYLGDQGLDLNVVYSSSKDDWINSFVKENYGITFMPKSQAINEGMFYVEVADYAVSRAIYLEALPNALERHHTQAFVDAICTSSPIAGLAPHVPLSVAC